ncbi:KAP family P-loop NTPase fold protein [Enterobacter sp. BNK-22]|uniref:KAP family P-loop NTPase fold protein n=1 Tax=Enterobacter sp. BNK-22 TaxID=3376157 RepID=UPI003B511A98
MTKHLELPFNWSDKVEDLPPDTLERSEYARFLTSFLVDKGTNGNYVLNLDAQWGAGKTWFIRRWMHEISNTYPTVYIDAWKNDHSGDPFLTVVSEIKSALTTKTELSILENNVIKGTWRLMKSIAPEVTKCFIKNKLGIDTADLDLDSEADLGSKIVDELLKSHEQANSSAENFKLSIHEWLEAVIDTNEGKYAYPLFIFIDELDRCRPNYAIDMLETIKHLFDIRNVVFVIATDKEQLIHSICSVYGSGFDARRYLDRFFMRSVTLKKRSLFDFIEKKVKDSIAFNKTIQNCDLIIHDKHNPKITVVIDVLTNIADGFSMDLRTANLWLERLESIYSHTNKNIELVFLSFLLAIYTRHESYYKKMLSGVDLFSDNSKDPISKVFKPLSNLTVQTSTEDISLRSSSLNNHPIHEFIFSEKINPLNLIIIIRQQFGNVHNHRNKKEKLLRDIYNSPNDYEKIEKETYYTYGNQYKINQATDIYFAKYYEENPITLKDYHDLCELAMLIE